MLPGDIGQYGLVISVVNSAGSSLTDSLPWGRPWFAAACAEGASGPLPPPPQAATDVVATAIKATTAIDFLILFLI